MVRSRARRVIGAAPRSGTLVCAVRVAVQGGAPMTPPVPAGMLAAMSLLHSLASRLSRTPDPQPAAHEPIAREHALHAFYHPFIYAA
jgi:hypothetical protein